MITTSLSDLVIIFIWWSWMFFWIPLKKQLAQGKSGSCTENLSNTGYIRTKISKLHDVKKLAPNTGSLKSIERKEQRIITSEWIGLFIQHNLPIYLFTWSPVQIDITISVMFGNSVKYCFTTKIVSTFDEKHYSRTE